MKKNKIFLGILVAALITIPVFAYTFPSTNELNKNQMVPGREGQKAPYVELVEADVGEVTLDFVGGYTGYAYFEYRADGIEKTDGTDHPVVIGDYIYPGVGVNANITVPRTLTAQEYVEVRLALGGERDWDFDWTRFDVLPNPDIDGDGILNEDDFCPNTLEDEPSDSLGVNRHIWEEGDIYFKTLVPGKKGTFNPAESVFSMEDTKGCSCSDILSLSEDQMEGHWKFGCSKSVIEDFIASFEEEPEPEWVELETITVPCDKTSYTSSTESLTTSGTYQIEASGTCFWRNEGSSGGYIADAEYWLRNDFSYSNEWVHMGIWSLAMWDGNPVEVEWGSPVNLVDHTYTIPYTVSADGPVMFLFNDDQYSDNSGSLNVTIYEWK